MHNDYRVLGRIYFPGLSVDAFNQETKRRIEEEIEADFQHGLEGIRKLPQPVRFGVYLAYTYFHALFRKIRRSSPSAVLASRIRVSNSTKYVLLAKAALNQYTL